MYSKFNNHKHRLRVIFVGNETRILSYLICNEDELNIDLCAVYAYRPKWTIKNFRKWITQYFWWRCIIRVIKDFKPTLDKKHWRHFALYETEKMAHRKSISQIRSYSINSRKFQKEIKSRNVDLAIVASFEQKINNKTLALTQYGYINFHPGKLPEYRGRKPIEKALLNDDKSITICWHWMTDKIDAGDVIESNTIAVNEKSAKKILDMAVVSGCNMLNEILTSKKYV